MVRQRQYYENIQGRERRERKKQNGGTQNMKCRVHGTSGKKQKDSDAIHM